MRGKGGRGEDQEESEEGDKKGEVELEEEGIVVGFGGLGLSEPWLELVIAFARGVLNPGPGISLYDMIIIILILLS